MAALDIELVLSPEELLAVMDRGARDAHVAADTGAHERDLAAPAVLLGEVRALHCRVAGGGRELLQLELVDAIGGGEGKKDERSETGEQHGGGGQRAAERTTAAL